jgi:hypothetical protein
VAAGGVDQQAAAVRSMNFALGVRFFEPGETPWADEAVLDGMIVGTVLAPGERYGNGAEQQNCDDRNSWSIVHARLPVTVMIKARSFARVVRDNAHHGR